jgi:hypothetical protein
MANELLEKKRFHYFSGLADDNIGHPRDVQSKPGRLAFPNLKISLFEASAQNMGKLASRFCDQGQ